MARQNLWQPNSALALTAEHEQPHTVVVSDDARWGWLPALTVTSACALVLAAFAFSASRSGQQWAIGLYWISLLLIFVPAAFRLAAASTSRRERIGLVVVAGLALYLVKVLHSPVDFTFHDEFLHWRTAADILSSQRLFTENTILTVSPLYPGLEIVTTAFVNLSGLTVYQSALVTLGIGRIVFMLALYLLYEQVGRSAQIGGIAALVYMGNSNFLYFDAQFSYETLSLPIATAVLAFVLFRQHNHDRNLLRMAVLILPLVVLVVVTHHLTAYALVGFLSLWALIAVFVNRREREWLDVGIIATLSLVIVVIWMQVTGNATEGYLGPVFSGGISELLRLIISDDSGRRLFQGATGQSSPSWEPVVGMASVIFILVALPFGVVQVWRSPFGRRFREAGVKVLSSSALQAWKRYGTNPIAFVLTLIVLIYPAMQGFRLTSSGWEIANRSSEFVFWATAFIATIGVFSLRWVRMRSLWSIGFVVWATVIFVGGAISGWPPWARMPGSYLVSSDSRSIEPQSLSAAQWTSQYLDPADRIAADRINTLLLATYGRMRPVTHQYDHLYMSPIFVSPDIGPGERALMAQVGLRYLLVDDRLSTGLPGVGVYFEAGEPGGGTYRTPIPLSALSKFDGQPDVSRIFDSGDIQIYDVRLIDALP